MKPKKWKNLIPGDIVDVVAPASRSPKPLARQAPRAVRSLGLKARIPKTLFDQSSPFFAAADKVRAQNLIRALKSPDSKLIWCTRGGYGCARLLPYLEKINPPAQAKLLLGYSDITALHVFLRDKWGWPTLHGPVLDRLASGKLPAEDSLQLNNILFGAVSHVIYSGLKPMNSKAQRASRIQGRVGGGNLAVYLSLFGTRFEPQPPEILVLEDQGERGYRVDRLLNQLLQSGHLENVKCVVFGEFIGGVEPGSQRSYVRRAIQDFAKSLSRPVFEGLKFGHGVHNRPLPFGTAAVLRKTREGVELQIETGVQARGKS